MNTSLWKGILSFEGLFHRRCSAICVERRRKPAIWHINSTDRQSQNPSGSHTLMTCINLLLRTFTVPVWGIGITLLYFDLRIRKEGFDIETRMDEGITVASSQLNTLGYTMAFQFQDSMVNKTSQKGISSFEGLFHHRCQRFTQRGGESPRSGT